MKYADWSTLKAASKVAFKKIAAVAEVKEVTEIEIIDGVENIKVTTAHVSPQKAYTVLEKKVYDANTGAESTKQEQMTLGDLERVKAGKTAEKAALTIEIAEIGKMITQIKKV